MILLLIIGITNIIADMSIKDIDVKTAIRELDKSLLKYESQYVLYTCGGAALIFLGYEGRGTGDIDIILEQFDPNLERAVIEVAKKYALKQGKVETYEVFVNHYVRELMSELGIK